MMVLASPVGRVVGREVRGEWVFLADRTWFLLQRISHSRAYSCPYITVI